MTKINCVIADDEALAREILEGYIAQLSHLHLVASCSGGAAVYSVLQSTPVDLLFLDINMPLLSGLELLRTLKDPPMVILTTAYREYALSAYELNVIDYLLKPIAFDRFLKGVQKYEHIMGVASLRSSAGVAGSAASAKEAFMYIRSDKRMVRVMLADILYIEGLKDYVKIQMVDRTVVTYQTLASFEDKLPADQFARVHRSYIVAMGNIDSYTA